ncbi:MAG: ABC transporter permease [Candidatus Thiodiazotropha sp. (ex Myrtea spinifera)]|nr:ABC transporter permease [Candidatus Thiodiazotropha sp. (ex Myrtea spinifera)]
MSVRQVFELVDVQARMSLKAEASRLYLSYIWWVLEPILFILVFYLVFEILLNIGRENYLLFLICGKIPFLWFSKSVTNASNSIVQNKGLIGQLDMPKYLFPYISIQESLYKQWVVFFVMFGVVITYGYLPEWNWLWLIPLMIAQYGLIVVFSLLAALMVSFIGDFRMLINMGMMFLMFASGIFWDINAIADPQLREWVFIYNPMTFLIDGYRQVLMRQSTYSLEHLVVLASIILVGIVISHQLLHKYSRIIAAKVVNS